MRHWGPSKGRRLSAGEWGEPSISMVCAVVCALGCFCANLYQLWIFY